jgi:hypothetical protein
VRRAVTPCALREEKSCQPFEAENVWMAHALQPRDNEFDALRLYPLLQRFKISLQLRRGAKEQFALKIVDEESRIDGCVRMKAVAHSCIPETWATSIAAIN